MNDPIHTIEGTIILENDTPVLDIIRLDRLNEIIYNN